MKVQVCQTHRCLLAVGVTQQCLDILVNEPLPPEENLDQVLLELRHVNATVTYHRFDHTSKHHNRHLHRKTCDR
jgi:hypothetical protein